LGVGWGLQNKQTNIPRVSTHFDEGFSVQCCKQIDIKKYDINPESGQIDGSFTYYLWTVNAFILKSVGLLDKMPTDIISVDQNYSDFIYFSRLLMVFFDIVSLVLIYFIVRKITGNINSSLIAALIFAILPFEIMHSNYMRPHILLNTFLLLIIYLSLFIYEHNEISLFIKIGIVLGLCVSTRFTFINCAIIPIGFFYYHHFANLKSKSIKPVFAVLFNYKLLIMFTFLLFGLFIGNPSWFLDFKSVIGGIIYQNQLSRDMNNGLSLNFIRLSDYFFWIIPAGIFYLWMIFYPAYFYSFVIKRYLKYTIPLTIYAIIYFIPMALVYPIEVIRIALPLFPIFTIVSGIVIAHLVEKFSYKRNILSALYIYLGFILISVSVFSYSVVRAMGDKTNDSYVQLFEYLKKLPQKEKMNIATIAPSCGTQFLNNLYYIYKFLPEKEIVMYNGILEKYELGDNYNVEVNYDSMKNNKIEYIVIGEVDYNLSDSLSSELIKLTKCCNYYIEKKFINEIYFSNNYYNYYSAPIDFRYPFQVFYLLKKNKL
jgi:hypothetical protein